MVSLAKIQTIPKSPEHSSGPRISFSADFLNDEDFISINTSRSNPPKNPENVTVDKGKSRVGDFEFLSNNNASTQTMTTADELFFEGKLLPYWQIGHIEKLTSLNLKEKSPDYIDEEERKRQEFNNHNNNNNSNRVNWFIDDDPSPRPPSCTVLWKELLRLKKKQHPTSSLSPSSSSSSSSSSSAAVFDLPVIQEEKEGTEKKEKHVKKVKKGLERTRSGSIRIRPMVSVPVCSQGKSNVLAPLFALKKGRLER